MGMGLSRSIRVYLCPERPNLTSYELGHYIIIISKPTFTKFPSMPGGRGQSIPGLVSESGQGLHFLRSGKPKEMVEVITDMRHASKICKNRTRLI